MSRYSSLHSRSTNNAHGDTPNQNGTPNQGESHQSELLVVTRRNESREVRATLALTVFVLSQWVLPQALLLQSLKPASAATTSKSTQADSTQAGTKGNLSSLTTSSKSTAMPTWYKAARQKELQRVSQTKTGVKMLLAQNTDRRQPGITVVPLQSDRAVAASGAPLIRNTFPGDVKASKPLSKMPHMSSIPLRLAKDGVPTQAQIVAEGGLAGPLSPVANAEVRELVSELDSQLKAEGFAGGTATPFVTTAEAEAIGTPSLVQAARRINGAKERVKKAKDQNREFLQAIKQWNDNKFQQANQSMDNFIKKYPKSPWTPEAYIHMGNYAKYNGRPNDSEKAYRHVMDVTSADPKEMSYNAHRKAFGRLTDLYLIEQRFSEARPMLEDFLYNDTNWRRRTWALYWLTQLNAREGNPRQLLADLDCGTQALAALLHERNLPLKARNVLALKPRSEKGFSFAELRQIAAKEGVQLAGFSGNVQQLSKLPMPVLLQYSAARKGASKVTDPYAHIVMLRSYDAKRRLWQVRDPQDGSSSVLKSDELARQWSGKGLMLASATTNALKPEVRQASLTTQASLATPVATVAPKSPVLLSMAEMRSTYGTGYGVRGQARLGRRTGRRGVKKSCAKGEPDVSVDYTSQNIYIADVPLWYEPSIGPKVEISLSYNSLDATNYHNFMGNKWTLNYGSYIVQMPSGSGTTSRVVLFSGDGAQETYYELNTIAGTTNYMSPRGNYSKLTKAGSMFTLTNQGGDRAIYTIPTLPGGATTTLPYLTRLVDRWGKTLQINHGVVHDQIVPFTVQDADLKYTRFQYDAEGRLVYVQTPDQKQARFTYDTYGNLIQCIDCAGQAFQYAYDEMATITQLNTPQGPWTFRVDFTAIAGGGFNNYKTSIYDPSQSRPEAMVFETEASGPYHNPGHYYYVDRRGNSTDFEVGVLDGPTPPGDSSPVSSYPIITKLAPPVGQSSSYTYEVSTASNLVVPTGMTSGAKTATFTYNPQGQMTQSVSSISGASKTNTFVYDGNGLDLKSATVSGIASGTPSLTQTLLQNANYDAYHQPTQITDGAGNVTNYVYTGWGAVDSSTTSLGSTDYIYGTAGTSLNRLTSVVQGTATIESYTYDASGRTNGVTDAAGSVTKYRYNDLDAPTSFMYADGTTVLIDYTCCGLPGMVTDRSGRRVYYDYDNLKRLIRVQDASGMTLQFEYDANDNRTAMIDSRGAVTTWAYDAGNRIVSKIYPDGASASQTYASEGWVDSSTDSFGRTTAYSHNNFGDVTLVNFQSPAMTDLSLTYDSLGRQKTISDSVGTTTVSYDNLGRLTSEDGPWANDTLTFNYGSRNELQSLIVGRDGTTNDAIAYTYNTAANILGTPATVSATLGSWGSTGTFTYGYSGVVPTTFDRPNGVRTTYTYEPLLDRVSGVQNALVTPATNQSKFTYAYGTTGANASPEGFRDVQSTQTRQYAAQPQQTLTYGYDRSSRLTAEDATVGGANTPAIAAWASFDAMGNRTQWQNDVAQHNFQATYNTANQITQVRRNSVATPPDSTQTATTNFGYDAAGNQTSAVLLNGASVVQSTVTYTYDDLDRLTSIATVGSDKWEFIYDGSSRLRISKYYLWQTGGTPQWVEQVAQQKRRVYSGNDIVQERNSSNVVTASLVRDGGVGGLLARVTSSATADQVFYSYDMAGNVTSLSDKTGTAVAYYTYDSWGNTLAMTGTKASANPYRYTTKESFGGYYHFGYRFYNPGIGRWLNRDPLGEDGGPNLYTFSNNSPNNFIDPDGAITHILAGAAIGGTIGAVFEGGREIWNGGSVGSVAKAALRGGVVGAVSGATGAWIAPVATAALGGTIYAGAAGGAIAGAAGDAAGQGLELAVGWRCKFDVGEMVMAGGMGGIGGALGAKAKLGTNCFVAGTPVVMADGSNKEIEQVKEGDLVLSRDEATGETAAKKVEHTSLRQADATLLFTFSDGTEVECSDEHPFYVESQGFKPAREIGVGTSIVTKAGPAHVIKVEQKHEQKNLYNFTVEGFHTYFVGRSALWVHNAPCETLIRYGSDAEAESIKLSQKLSFRPGHKGPDGGVKWVGGPQATINPKNLGSTYKNKFVIHVKPGTTKWLQENNFELKPDVEPGRFAIPTASLDAFNERVTKIVVSALK